MWHGGSGRRHGRVRVLHVRNWLGGYHDDGENSGKRSNSSLMDTASHEGAANQNDTMRGSMKVLKLVFLAALLLVGPVHFAQARKNTGPAPAGCWWGPRGGLHCPRHVKSSSEESATQSEKRLMRECKGRPNAGACLGYAR